MKPCLRLFQIFKNLFLLKSGRDGLIDLMDLSIAGDGSKKWKLEYNARTSAERCNKSEKVDYKLEDGRYRSSKMWYCRLFAIMMCQHLDAWNPPKASLKNLFEQAA